jgi:hypothetical protein
VGTVPVYSLPEPGRVEKVYLLLDSSLELRVPPDDIIEIGGATFLSPDYQKIG